MTRSTQERLLKRIAEVDHDLGELRRVRMEIAESGVSSASLSSGGGSKSYSRIDLGTITSLMGELMRELTALRSRLSGSGPIRRIQFVR